VTRTARRSLAEHLALAPPAIRDAIVGLVEMCEMSDERRRQVVEPIRRHDPQLADDVLAALPPAGLAGQALVDAELALVVEQLGERHGGVQWLRDTGRLPGGPS
jgi:hypothetical protein